MKKNGKQWKSMENDENLYLHLNYPYVMRSQ